MPLDDQRPALRRRGILQAALRGEDRLAILAGRPYARGLCPLAQQSAGLRNKAQGPAKPEKTLQTKDHDHLLRSQGHQRQKHGGPDSILPQQPGSDFGLGDHPFGARLGGGQFPIRGAHHDGRRGKDGRAGGSGRRSRIYPRRIVILVAKTPLLLSRQSAFGSAAPGRRASKLRIVFLSYFRRPEIPRHKLLSKQTVRQGGRRVDRINQEDRCKTKPLRSQKILAAIARAVSDRGDRGPVAFEDGQLPSSCRRRPFAGPA